MVWGAGVCEACFGTQDLLLGTGLQDAYNFSHRDKDMLLLCQSYTDVISKIYSLIYVCSTVLK